MIYFASTEQPLAEVAAVVASRFPDAVVMGASTAGEFTEAGDAKGSLVGLAMAGDFVVRAGMSGGLAKGAEGAVASSVADLPEAVPGYMHKTALLMLDPFAGNGEEVALLTAGYLGPDVPLAGGAAGDDLAMKHTEVALGANAETDAMVVGIIFSKAPFGIGVCHGHAPISEPLTVTRAEGATVYEVDGRPAWEVWAEHTKSAAAARGVDPDTVSDDDIGAFLLRYEAGLASGDEYKIRAPLGRGADGSLSFATAVPEGAKIRITEGPPDGQIDAARTAAQRAYAKLGEGGASGAIVFDCICRNLILGDRFKDAVGAIAEELGNVPLAGFETYGEIALDAGDLSGFHNTTTVVLAVPR
ncbi:MAG: FIST signal transduction protein [Sandaracinaceae bacterium]